MNNLIYILLFLSTTRDHVYNQVDAFAPKEVLGKHVLTLSKLLRAPLESVTQVESLKHRSTNGHASDTCVTAGCIKTAAFLLENMNATMDPCQDFYNFACGGYLKKTILFGEKSMKSVLLSINNHLEERLTHVLENATSECESKTAKMTKMLYRTCMNQTHIDEQGILPLRDVLIDMGGWPVLEMENWDDTSFSTISALNSSHKRGFLTNSLFSFEVDSTDTNSTYRSIVLDLPDFGIDSDYLLAEFNDSSVQAYYHYAVKVAEHLGAFPEQAEAEMKDAIMFEMQLANISESYFGEEGNNSDYEEHSSLTIIELGELAPQIPWMDLINTFLPPSVQINMDEKVVVKYPNHFRRLLNLTSQANKRTLANYMVWRVIQEAVPYLSEEINEHLIEMNLEIEDESENIPRWNTCLQLVQEKMPFGLANLYIKSYFPEESKRQVKLVGQYLRAAFNAMLKHADWMDDVTKMKALAKFNATQFHFAYPDKLLLDSKLDEFYNNLIVDDHSLYENVLQINKFSMDYKFGLLHQKFDKQDWKNNALVASVDGSYDNEENTLKIPAGALQGILFEQNNPMFVNFAGIGFGIGQEIVHGFDDEGCEYDAEGHENMWWLPQTNKKYKELEKCFANQYSHYTVQDVDLKLSDQNSEEDIADNGGIKAAYKAYQLWALDNGQEKILPGMSYGTNQLFWISAAQKMCAKYRPDYLKQLISVEEDTPNEFRVNGPYSNSKYFALDFNCAEGSRMNPTDKCVIW